MSEPLPAKASLPPGAVAILFTDIEGSTVLWEQDGGRMSQALAAHDALARRAVERHCGTVVRTTGDGMHAVFDDALDAIAATVDLQQALADPAVTNGVALRVRCGLHAGVVERRDNDYFGSPVNRAARIMSAAHGGQVLLSQAVVDGMRQILPAEVSLRDLGMVRLKDMSNPEHVYQVLHRDLRQQFPALRSLEAIPNNLPQQVTSFVGREQALADLKRLLARVRLVTLTGSGGCGKTRLALQVAADSLERFPDGVWLVELSPLVDPGLVPQTVATVLGLKEVPGKPISQTLTEHLKDRRLLLLLDNCEHLLDGCARLVDLLMRQCPAIAILASSREALGIGGEQTYRVPSLSQPDPKQLHTPASIAPFEAVQLFTDRALLARTDFQVTDQNASTLASICYRLDGIPLAIELAAARVRSLTAEEINSRLDQRFRLLTGAREQRCRVSKRCARSSTGATTCCTNPRSCYCNGYRYLPAVDVGSGRAGLRDEGVEAREVLNLLTSLCDKSLVVVERNDGHSRYRLLETVRQYSREILFESGGGEAVRDQHRKCFLTLAEEAEPQLTGADQAVWLRCLDEEHDNLRSALEWSHAGAGPKTGLRLCGALGRFWEMRTHLSEGRQWCARVLNKAGAEERTPERAKVLNVTGTLAWFQADYRAARQMHEESLAIVRELGDRGWDCPVVE